MLYLYPSNKTENLAGLMAEIIDRHPLSKPFQPETILIQSQGMGTWLQQQLSAYSGVAALIDCTMPASFIWDLAERLMPDRVHKPLFEKNNLRWELFRRLPEKLDKPEYLLLKQYLERQAGDTVQDIASDSSGPSGLPAQSYTDAGLFELSSVIADVFDAYQNYRPEWIEAWEKGQKVCAGVQENGQKVPARLQALEAWQADLWCSVYPSVALDERYHRSRLFAELISRLGSASKQMQAMLPERLFIFGLSALPPHWLSLISALAKYLDVHFMVQNPCQYYWGDVLSPLQKLKYEQSLVAKGVSVETAAESFLEGNPLLASWGKLGRDYLSLLSNLPDIREVDANLFEDPHRENAEMVHALGLLQSDIMNLNAQQHAIQLADDSIRFADCHSALREVEALQDYLFDLLERHPQIKPKDIIVMMPDVQDFAPIIDAVFSRPAYDIHGQPHYLPYGISDQRLSTDQPLLEALASLLSLSSSRLSGTQVLDWLEMPAIRSRFEISEAELEDVKTWIRQLNIRWGLSEAHRDAVLSMSGTGEGNTWMHACRRLLAGYLFGEEDILEHSGKALLAFPQRSAERQRLAGKLMHFLDVIDSTIRLQAQSLPLAQWLEALSGLWQDWLDFELLAQDIQQVLSRVATNLEAEIACAEFHTPVSFDVIADILTAEFENQRVSQRFLAGRINFCTLMPMRSIPFQVVCMLGMNEGAYPRPVTRQSFDLLTMSPARAGDRSRRDDDRYLFLEALCSARSHLYLSYCGRDIQDNSERFPSLLVSELQDYCAQYFYLSEPAEDGTESILKAWTLKHHLQPFHPAYFFSDITRYSDKDRHVESSSHKKTVCATDDLANIKTFSSEWLRLINPQQQAGSPVQDMSKTGSSPLAEDSQTQEKLIKLEDLMACANHPLRYYYHTTLQLHLRDVEEELSASEPFSVSGLESYALKKELVQNWFLRPEDNANEPENDLLRYWQLADKLPRPPLDRFYVDSIQHSVRPMYDYLAQTLADRPVLHELDLQVEQYRIGGAVFALGNCLTELTLSKKPGSSFFSFWVKHVFWSWFYAETSPEAKSDDSSLSSRFIGPESEIRVPLLPGDLARDYALVLCRFFEAAQLAPYVFLPRTTYAALFESPSKAGTQFYGSPFFPGEYLDPYWQRYCQLSDSGRTENPDPQQMPVMEASIFFQQIDPVKEQIQIVDLKKHLQSIAPAGDQMAEHEVSGS